MDHPAALPVTYADAHRMNLTAEQSIGMVMDSYEKGAAVTVLGFGMANNTMWRHVFIEGKIGFMSAAYLSYG
jgi:hypothetical protein